MESVEALLFCSLFSSLFAPALHQHPARGVRVSSSSSRKAAGRAGKVRRKTSLFKKPQVRNIRGIESYFLSKLGVQIVTKA